VRTYEIMLILPPDAEDGAIAGITDRISAIVGDRGGEVRRVDRWGKRRLTYEIRRQTEGFYVIAECAADPGMVKELDRVLALADEVLRFKIVVRPEVPSRKAGAA
jgi:small subunit ribosomal protein S6